MRYAVAYLNMFENEIHQKIIEATTALSAMKSYMIDLRLSQGIDLEDFEEDIENAVDIGELYDNVLTDEEVISAILVD